MKLLKIGIIVCTLTLGIGIIGTGATLGNLYKNTQLTYETNLEEKLDLSALTNIYIKSDVPVRVETTTGEPMVTFKSSTTGLIIPEPLYELSVKPQGNTTYIDITDKSNRIMDFYFGGNYEEAVVYLPEEAITKLEINTHGYVEYLRKGDVNELVIDGGNVTLKTEGNLGKVEIDGNYIEADILSHTAAIVEIDGSYGNVDLKGKYKEVVVDEIRGGKVHVESDNLYTANVSGSDTRMRILGAIDSVEVAGDSGSEVTIQATTVPKYIGVESYYGDVHITLPKDIPGFTGIYKYENTEQMIYTNFDIEAKPIGERTKRLQYGEGVTNMMLNVQGGDVSIMK